MRLKEMTAEKVLPPEITSVVRNALISLVDGGTAQKIRGAFVRSDGNQIAVG
jgi:hypothetical protein